MQKLKTKLIIFSLIITIPSILAVSIVSLNNSRKILKEQALKSINDETLNSAHRIENMMMEHRADLLAIANTPPTRAMIRAKNNQGIDPISKDDIQTWRNRFTTILKSTLKAKKFYQQIRFLYEGKEVVRVDFKDGKVIETVLTDLQDKSIRIYFKEAIKLEEGEIYVAPLNLSKEHGRIEIPYTPVLRFSTPIFAKGIKTPGVVVINVYADHFLGHLKKGTVNVTLANEKGYYLQHEDDSKTFGFEFGKKENNIYFDYPKEMKNLEERGSYSEVGKNQIESLQKIHFDLKHQNRYWTISKFYSSKEILKPIQVLQNQMILIVLIIIPIVLFLAIFISTGIVIPIKKIVSIANKIANGDLDSEINIKGFQEVSLLGKTLSCMQSQIKERSQQIKENEAKNRIIVDTLADCIVIISEKGVVQSINQAGCNMFGYLKEEVMGQNVKLLMPDSYRREHDGYLDNYKKTGIKNIIGSGREVSGVRKDKITFPLYLTVAEIKLKEEKLFAGVLRDISEVKQRENDLHKIASEQENQLWLMESQNKLNNKMRGANNVAELSRNIVSCLADIVSADMGIVHILEKDNLLKLSGSYALKDTENEFHEFKLGEGLIGQAALKKENILLSEIPEDLVKINYGCGEVLPHYVLIMPILYEDKLIAVITLGALNEFSQQQRIFLNQTVDVMGIALNNVKAQEQIKNLLALKEKT